MSTEHALQVFADKNTERNKHQADLSFSGTKKTLAKKQGALIVLYFCIWRE